MSHGPFRETPGSKGLLVVFDEVQATVFATHVLPLVITFDNYGEDATVATNRGLLLVQATSSRRPEGQSPRFVRSAYFSGTSSKGIPLEVVGARWDFEKSQFQPSFSGEDIELEIV